jgi:hypothetical protein
MGTRHLYWIFTGPSFAVQHQQENKQQQGYCDKKFRGDEIPQVVGVFA